MMQMKASPLPAATAIVLFMNSVQISVKAKTLPTTWDHSTKCLRDRRTFSLLSPKKLRTTMKFQSRWIDKLP